MQKQRSDASERLRTALELRNMSVYKFSQALEASRRERGAPLSLNAARQVVHRALGSKRPPKLEFLAEAAAILNVDLAWLSLGSGSADPVEKASSDRAAGAVGLQREATIELQATIARAVGKSAQYSVVETWTPLATEVLRRVGDAPGRSRGRRHHNPDAPETLGKALRAPLDLLDVNVGLLSEEVLNTYLLAALVSLLPVVRDRQRINRGYGEIMLLDPPKHVQPKRRRKPRSQ